MYLRTTKRKNKDGSVAEYYQLAHNERHPVSGKAVAKIIHNFGRTDKLDRQQLKRLCRSIARVCELTVIDPDKDQPEDSTLPDDLKIDRTVMMGTLLAIEALWEKTGLKKTLLNLARDNRMPLLYERALFAMVANRLCAPESKLGVWDRWLENVYLPSCEGLKLRHMYEAMDLLHDHAPEVEKTVFWHIANIFNLEVDLIFYDTTTASFTTDYADDPERNPQTTLRSFGHSKEGTWSTQVVVALAVTREGIPVRSWVLPGNTADSTLLACKMASVAEIKREVLSKRGRYTVFRDNLSAKEVIVGDGERRKRYILCYNPKEAKRQKKHRQSIVELLEKELDRHPNQSATAQWAIELLASRRYKRYLRITKSKQIRIDRTAIRNAARYDGKWVIETNDDTISLEDAALGYKSLMVIERCFRSLKRTQIKMTPMYHWLSRRIESHVKICVLALMIERLAERACNKPWHQIRRDLDALQVTKFFNLNQRVHIRNEISNPTRNLLKKMDIRLPKRVIHLEKTP